MRNDLRERCGRNREGSGKRRVLGGRLWGKLALAGNEEMPAEVLERNREKSKKKRPATRKTGYLDYGGGGDKGGKRRTRKL